MKVLMVCLGNICRSPLAEGILQAKIDYEKLDWYVDSAGTSGYHNGEKADPRSRQIAHLKGIDIDDQRSRIIKMSDFVDFDLILAMDSSNFQDICRLKPKDSKTKVELIMNYLEEGRNINVPDPYYGDSGFENVYNMLDLACHALIKKSI